MDKNGRMLLVASIVWFLVGTGVVLAGAHAAMTGHVADELHGAALGLASGVLMVILGVAMFYPILNRMATGR